MLKCAETVYDIHTVQRYNDEYLLPTNLVSRNLWHANTEQC